MCASSKATQRMIAVKSVVFTLPSSSYASLNLEIIWKAPRLLLVFLLIGNLIIKTRMKRIQWTPCHERPELDEAIFSWACLTRSLVFSALLFGINWRLMNITCWTQKTENDEVPLWCNFVKRSFKISIWTLCSVQCLLLCFVRLWWNSHYYV